MNSLKKLIAASLSAAVALSLGAGLTLGQDLGDTGVFSESPFRVTPGDIEDNSALYVGEVVSVYGEVDNCGEYGSGAFELEGDEWLFGEEDVVVLTPQRDGFNALLNPLGFGENETDFLVNEYGPLDGNNCGGVLGGGAADTGLDGTFDRDLGFGLEDDEEVRVIGVVRMFNRNDFENELGFGLDNDLASDAEGEAVIIAIRIIDPGLPGSEPGLE